MGKNKVKQKEQEELGKKQLQTKKAKGRYSVVPGFIGICKKC